MYRLEKKVVIDKFKAIRYDTVSIIGENMITRFGTKTNPIRDCDADGWFLGLFPLEKDSPEKTRELHISDIRTECPEDEVWMQKQANLIAELRAKRNEG